MLRDHPNQQLFIDICRHQLDLVAGDIFPFQFPYEKYFLWLLTHHPNCWNLTLFSFNLYLTKKLTNHQNRMGFRKLKSGQVLRIAESLPFSSSATATHGPFRQFEVPLLNPSGLRDQLQRLLQNTGTARN